MKPHDTLGPRHRLTARPVRHSPFALVLALIIAFGMPARADSPAPAAVIDDCQYSGDVAARAAWQPMRGTAAVATAMLDGRKVLRLPCNFTASNVERASWDRAVRLDLTSSRGIQFKVLCRNALPVSYFSIYFQSGEGWYHAAYFSESSTAWNTIDIDKSEMKSEGKPAGWSEIKTIRVSAWRGKAVNTELYLSDIRKTDPLPPPGPRELAEAAISRIGKIASFNTYEEATNQVAASGNRNARVAKALVSTASLRESALKLAGQQQFTEATEQAAAAREQLVRAYCLAQKPLLDEFRGFWCHSAFGVQGMDWDEAIHRLADNGFTAILPNMLWGGAAFYESKVLPVAAQISTRGDQIRQCLAACRKYGVQMHVWKVDWNLGSAAPKDFVARMRQAGRLQASSRGKEEPWLCPSRPDNDHCFCAGCKDRLEHAAGTTITNWPGAVLAEGRLRQQWLEWRRGNITAVVRAVSEQARAVKPRIKLSAAVFPNWAVDRDGVGQDWKLWCEKGYLDFVCPMDYTPSNHHFETMVAQQVEWAGRTPCYPGLGVSASSSRLGADRAIEQINITRRYQTHGFVIFNYGVKESNELLPMLGLGITAKPQSGSAP